MDIEIPWDVPASLLEGVSVFSNLHPSIHSSIRLFNHPSIPPSLCQSIRPSFLSGTLPMEVYKKRSTSLSFLRSLIQRFVYSFIESYLTTFWTFVQVPHNRILLIALILSPQLFITCSGRKQSISSTSSAIDWADFLAESEADVKLLISSLGMINLIGEGWNRWEWNSRY